MRMLTAGCSSLLECINLFSCFLIPGEGTLEALGLWQGDRMLKSRGKRTTAPGKVNTGEPGGGDRLGQRSPACSLAQEKAKVGFVQAEKHCTFFCLFG